MSFDQDEINLRYLANTIYCKKNKNKEDKIIHNDDILFYKKRLAKIFKLQLKNFKINDDIDNIFNNYISQLIYKFKIEDRNEEIQKNLNNKDVSLNNIIILSNDISLNDQPSEPNKLSLPDKINENYNKIIYNSQKQSMNTFVINNKQPINYPKVKNININTDYYKKKNLKQNKNIKTK
jgi:hypothetical protein